MTSKQLWTKHSIYYGGACLINGLHKFSAIVVEEGFRGEQRVEFKCNGTRTEAFDSAIEYFKGYERAE